MGLRFNSRPNGHSGTRHGQRCWMRLPPEENSRKCTQPQRGWLHMLVPGIATMAGGGVGCSVPAAATGQASVPVRTTALLSQIEPKAGRWDLASCTTGRRCHGHGVHISSRTMRASPAQQVPPDRAVCIAGTIRAIWQVHAV